MRNRRQNLNRWLRGALAALLLCAQAAALAHDLAHGPVPDAELCATCSIGGGLQATATSHAPPLVAPGGDHAAEPAPGLAPADGRCAAGHARAPPATS